MAALGVAGPAARWGHVLTMSPAKLLQCECRTEWGRRRADYVAPSSPPASMAVPKVKVPHTGRGVEPRDGCLGATGGQLRVKRPSPSVKTGHGQGRVEGALASARGWPHAATPPGQPVGACGSGLGRPGHTETACWSGDLKRDMRSQTPPSWDPCLPPLEPASAGRPAPWLLEPRNMSVGSVRSAEQTSEPPPNEQPDRLADAGAGVAPRCPPRRWLRAPRGAQSYSASASGAARVRQEPPQPAGPRGREGGRPDAAAPPRPCVPRLRAGAHPPAARGGGETRLNFSPISAAAAGAAAPGSRGAWWAPGAGSPCRAAGRRGERS